MAASNPLINSPHTGLGRHFNMPYVTRSKRSDSLQFDPTGGPRGLFDTARMQELNEEPTFIPTSLGEHLLERTYLDDVVRPLVRALVKARMTYGPHAEGAPESSQAYADLEKLRRELERSAQRARNAELERDDLARRLDLVGSSEVALHDRHDRQPVVQHMDLADQIAAPASSRAGTAPTIGLKRPRPSDVDSIRGGGYDQRSSVPASTGVSLNVAQGDGPASIIVATQGPSGAPFNSTSRPHHASGAEHMSPAMSYAHPGAPRHPPYPADMHHDPHDPEHRQMARMPHHPDAEYAYVDERADRYGLPSGQAAHRHSLSRYSGAARSPPTSSSYLTSASERSSMPTLTNYPSTSSSSSYSAATPYSSVHPYDSHEMEEMERSRKLARLRPGEPIDHHHSLGHFGRPLGVPPLSNYVITPTSEVPSAYPIRKLASTKNRTCSNCAAPHDAKFRRGPNGPGTLCDRCGSRWKKFKEQESASQRDSLGASGGPAAAAAAAHARLSSASASSESPVEASSSSLAPPPPATTSRESNRNSDSSIPTLRSTEGSASNGNGKDISPRDGERQGGRERSASVDQLIDD
ncbi:uncharacterized protein UHOD_07909 [Ustilago sp. UG-2017b]|nr:uncharacterized protein UHOD_07909 [Ustilago sp. UG-2017b]